MRNFLFIPLALAIGCSHGTENTKTTITHDPAPPAPSTKIGKHDNDHPCKGLVVFFEQGESTLSPMMTSQLNKLADCIDDKDAKEVIITGRTDPNGDLAANDLLAQRRAEAILAELRRLGMKDADIVIKVEGEVGTTDSRILFPFERRAEVEVKGRG